MSSKAIANAKNAALAEKIRAGSSDLRAEKLARLVEAQEQDVPAGVANVIFREPTAKERAHAKTLEPLAKKLLAAKHGK
jgi:ABC-type taurine transport system substrate-binding protein